MPETGSSVYDTAYNIATNLLGLNPDVDESAIERVIQQVRAMEPLDEVDFERLREDLEANYNVHVGGFSVLDDLEYRAWLAAKREQTDFEFWKRYSRFLREEKKIPSAVVQRLDELTDATLDRLRDPATKGPWDRRGLIVGDVQSGKTSNYTGLICKSFDAGFRLVIVLAGAHNSLRAQTQARLDEGVLGFDTRFHLSFDRENQRIGVGKLLGAPLLVSHSLTSSNDNGDFKRTTAQATQIIPGGNDPLLFVVKKNVSVLRNLLNWALSVRGEDDDVSPLGKTIRGVPLLIIDDEADYASANTNEYLNSNGDVIEDNDPTKTNKLIRSILASFEQSAYVGYTATPFANIFIHHEDYADEVGEGLFPRSFIISIPSPSNYLGPEKIFGLNREVHTPDEGLPVIRPVMDADAVFPVKHKKTHPVTELPSTLVEAIQCFLLACAARRARGDVNVHNSMLVHVTRFNAVQNAVANLVKEEFEDMRRQIEYPGSGGDVLQELQQVWENDFLPTSAQTRDRLPDEDLGVVVWSDVEREILPAARRIEVREVNGSAKDALDYIDHPDGLSVIAIGGDKLSRGLTLEGLSVSYFARTSRMYDTLMQMGRWFGYRPRYADLIRLYTSPVLVDWYRHIATASSELREEFDLMFARGLTPIDFGNRVQTHPDGLMITAANKMRAGKRVRAGFSGTISETVAFDIAPENVKANSQAFDAFIHNLGTPDSRPGEAFSGYVWREANPEPILELMDAVSTSRDSWKADSNAIAKYIRDRTSSERLKNWTVMLASSGKAKESARREIGGLPVGLVTRSEKSRQQGKYSIGRLVDPPHEWIDLHDAARDRAMERTVESWAAKGARGNEPIRPSGPFVREQRLVTDGLLLVYPIYVEDLAQPLMGFAISFPYDGEAPAIEYAENSVRRMAEVFD